MVEKYCVGEWEVRGEIVVDMELCIVDVLF